MIGFSIGHVQAAYLRDIPMTVTQPDGTVLHCFASGDEFFNYLHDKDGYTIIQHPQTGYYVYAENRDDRLVATEYVAGQTDPASKGLKPRALISPKEWAERRQAWINAEKRPQNHPQNRDITPNHGILNNISIFIRFSDDGQFTNSYYDIDNMFNDVSNGAVSMRAYFRAASYNAIEIPTTFYPGHNGSTIISYQDIYPRSYYQPYNAITNPNGYLEENMAEREFSLLERAVNYVNSNYPVPNTLDIDYDDDGLVDNVCFIVKGQVGSWSSLLWPHKWTLYDREVYINGKRVWTFNFQLADATDYFNTSTMCHEMNHSLGAPDLYHYYHGTELHPVGNWDLREYNTTPPQHCGAYMKMKYGHWIDDIPTITVSGTYTLNPISFGMPTNVAYKILTSDPSQFYVVEYRNTSSTFESALPGSGLLVYRINTNFEGGTYYNPDEGIYDEVYIFRPDGTATTNGDYYQAHFSSNVGRTEFSASTNPSPFFSDGTADPDFRIYNITSADYNISFRCDIKSTNENPGTEIYIGDGGTNTIQHLPSFSRFKYGLSQQIYTAEEIGTAGTIRSIAFYNDGGVKTRTFDFYLMATEKSMFGSNTDWEPVSEVNKVFSGTVDIGSGEWTTINLDTPFAYDGISNLVLVVDDNTGSYSSPPQMSCRVFDGENQALRIFNDNTDFDPSAPQSYTGTRVSVKNQLKLGITIPNGETVIVGDQETGNNVYLPSYSYYNYSFTQQIYTPEELGGSGIISSIGFYNEGTMKTRKYDFYLVPTDKVAFEENSDWVTVSEADKVFSGIVPMTAGDWTTIVFDRPFVYDGTSNLVLVVDDNTGSYTSSPHMRCRTFSAPSQALRIYSDDTNYNPMTLEEYTGTMMSVKNKIRMHVENSGELYVISDGGTTTNSYLPSYSQYKYSLTQQIYTAEEIGGAGTISSIGFYNGGATKTRTYDFYLIATDKTSFESSTDWVAVTDDNKVFSGEVTMTAGGWTMIDFDRPFVYDGTSNLILVADDNSGQWTSSPHMKCRTISAPSQALRIFNDNTNYDPSAPENYGGALMSKKNQIMMQIESAGELFVIGDGGISTSVYLPSYSYWKYSLSQQIYTAEEIGTAGTIHSMAFYNARATKTRTYDFYLIATDKTVFANSSDWVVATEDDKVFSGVVTMRAGEWTLIEFDKPFVYNGTSNLVLVADDNSGEWTEAPHMACRVFGAQGNQAIRIYNDDNNYDPSNPYVYSGTRHGVKTQMVFGIKPSPVKQTFALSQGWNWISTYIEITNPTEMLLTLETALVGYGQQIKNRNVSTEYDTEWGWFGDLDEVGFTNEEMIMIKTAADCTFELQGLPANPASHPITINPGWNWIGYPCAVEMTLNQAFSNFTPEVGDQIKNSEGSSEYDSEWGWFGDVENLVPGQGFMYYSNSSVPKTLVFQAGRKK